MKKYLLLIIGMMIITPFSVNAASTNINITSDKTTYKTNENINVKISISSSSNIGNYEYTLNYNSNILKLVRGNDYNMAGTNSNDTKRITKDFRFKAIKEGSAKISVNSYAVSNISGKNLSTVVSPLNLNITGNNDSNTQNSNFLSNLEIENYKLNPSFDKNISDYKVTINKNITSVNLIAEAQDANASINGNGIVDIKEGLNKLKVTVISTDNKERVYNIDLTLKKNEPIKTTIDNKDYLIINDISEKDIPDGFKEKKITINGKKVNALYNDKIDMTIVKLKDSNEEAFYIYTDDGNFKPYISITNKKITIIPKEAKETLKGFSNYTTSINNIDIDCYKIYSSSEFALIYGINTLTGEENWYSYNEKEQSLQKYNYEISDKYEEKIKSTETLIYILGGTTLLFGITTITLAIKIGKKKKNK